MKATQRMQRELTNQAMVLKSYRLFVVFLHGDTGFHCFKAYTLDKIIGQAEPFDDLFFGVIAFGFVDRLCVHVDLLSGTVVPARSNFYTIMSKCHAISLAITAGHRT